MRVVPNVNQTNPVGTVPLAEVTVAVKVTAWPTELGFCDEVKVICAGTATT
jgi:hypothetical protein